MSVRLRALEFILPHIPPTNDDDDGHDDDGDNVNEDKKEATHLLNSDDRTLTFSFVITGPIETTL